MNYLINEDDSIGPKGTHTHGLNLVIPYGRKFWQGIYFGRLTVLRAIHQYFISQKLHSYH